MIQQKQHQTNQRVFNFKQIHLDWALFTQSQVTNILWVQNLAKKSIVAILTNSREDEEGKQ